MLIPLFLIRYGLLSRINKNALTKAAHFPSMQGTEKNHVLTISGNRYVLFENQKQCALDLHRCSGLCRGCSAVYNGYDWLCKTRRAWCLPKRIISFFAQLDVCCLFLGLCSSHAIDDIICDAMCVSVFSTLYYLIGRTMGHRKFRHKLSCIYEKRQAISMS